MEFAAQRKETIILNPTKNMARKIIPSEIRFDPLTGRSARICHFMKLNWEKPDFEKMVAGTEKYCPFCPDKVHEVTQSYLDGDIEKSTKAHYQILNLCKAMFIETNPLPVKTALSLMGMVNKEWRLPLCEMEKANEEKLVKVLKEYKIV